MQNGSYTVNNGSFSLRGYDLQVGSHSGTEGSIFQGSIGSTAKQTFANANAYHYDGMIHGVGAATKQVRAASMCRARQWIVTVP